MNWLRRLLSKRRGGTPRTKEPWRPREYYLHQGTGELDPAEVIPPAPGRAVQPPRASPGRTGPDGPRDASAGASG